MNKTIILIMVLSTQCINSASIALIKPIEHSIQTIDGQSISFDPQLLLQSEVIKGTVTHFHNGELHQQVIEQFTHDLFTNYIFKDDNTVDKMVMNAAQALLLIQALESNNPLMAPTFAKDCPKQDRLWLINHLSQWNIEEVYNALMEHIIQDIASPLTMKEYKLEDLYDPIAMRHISQQCNIKDLNPHICKHVSEEYEVVLQCCTAPLKIIGFDNSGTYALMACTEHVHIFNIIEQKICASFKAPLNIKDDRILDAQCDAQNRILIHSRYNAYMYDLETKKQLCNYHCPYGSSIIGFVKNGEQLYVQNNNNTIISYNTDKHKFISWYQLPNNLVSYYNPHNDQQIVTSSDGTKLIIMCYHAPQAIRLCTYDLQEQHTYGGFTYQFPGVTTNITSVMFNNNHTKLLVTSSSKASLHNVETQQTLQYGPAREKLHLKSTQFINNDEEIVIADNNNITVYNIATNNQTWRWYRMPLELDSAAVTPDGSSLILTEQHKIHTHLFQLFQIEGDQKLLLRRASEGWKKDAPYLVPRAEQKIYDRLSSLLKHPALFTVKPFSKEAEKEEDT